MWYNESKRKPILRIRILQTLALRGKHAKKAMEKYLKEGIKKQDKNSHYKEISDAYDILSQNGLIERRNSSVPKEKPYALTKLGLRELIYRTEDIDDCWEYVLGFDLHSDEISNPECFADIIYNVLMVRYIDYKSIADYSHLLKVFHDMCIELEQRLDRNDIEIVLSALAGKNGKMSIAEIVSKTSKDEPTVVNILTELSMDSSAYTAIYDFTDEVDIENQWLRFMDFVQHLLIKNYQIDGEKCYEITLFGILLLLKMLRKYESSPTSRVRKFETKLQNIATSYHKSKLPLIFGKWSSLSNCLGLLAIYNFNMILIETNCPVVPPLVSNGNKELMESLYPMYLLNQEIRRKLLKSGIKIIKNFIKNPEQFMAHFGPRKWGHELEVPKYLQTLYRYLNFLLNYVNRDIDEIFGEIKKSNKSNRTKLLGSDNSLLGKIFERALADELTVSYYINLMIPYFNINLMPYGNLLIELHKSGMGIGEEYRKKGLPLISPIDYLKFLLTTDSEIKDFISEFMRDVTKYHTQLSGKIMNLTESLLPNQQLTRD